MITDLASFVSFSFFNAYETQCVKETDKGVLLQNFKEKILCQVGI